MKTNLHAATADLQAQTPSGPAATEPPFLDTPVNILIVDDEPRNLTVLESLLEDPGYRIVRAESADQALLALVVEEFALLILDIRMPGMNGIELAQMIKERKKTALVPIIFLTAYYNEDQHVLEGYGSGAVDYLHKPVNPAILRSKVAVFAELYRKRRECDLANRALLAEVLQRRRAEEQLRALTHRVMQGQETERAHVAFELHDHITQLLCGVLVHFEALANKLSTRDAPARQEVIKLRAMLGQTTEEVQRISRNLRPSVLDQLGLVAILRSDSAEFTKRTGVPLTVTCVALTTRLPAEAELAFYRIYQKALNNVEKYARARHVTVDLTRVGKFAQLVINDDGIGFDPDQRPTKRTAKPGFGLLSMRERVEMVGGRLIVESTPGKGTTIRADIPVQPRRGGGMESEKPNREGL